jgi:hypothetical protein
MMRVVDEFDEDYLSPSAYFRLVAPPPGSDRLSIAGPK